MNANAVLKEGWWLPLFDANVHNEWWLTPLELSRFFKRVYRWYPSILLIQGFLSEYVKIVTIGYLDQKI
jgi:hypothetical protein